MPERDPRLAEALRAHDPAAGPSGAAAGGHAADSALAARVVRAALPRLAELRRAPAPWWQWTAAWSRIAVPAGLAATLAAAVLLVRDDGGWIDPGAAQSAVADTAITESALVLGWSGGEGRSDLAAALVAPATDDWLLAEVLDR